MKTIAVIGSHGYLGKYGGWDQLVNNLVQFKPSNTSLIIYNPQDNKSISLDSHVKVIQTPFKGSGLQGILLDFFAVFHSFFSGARSFMFLGSKGFIFVIPFFLFNIRTAVNIGGVEWLRPQYSFLIRLYLKFSFYISCYFSNYLILDNLHYTSYLPRILRANWKIIPYGGFIDRSLECSNLISEFPWINKSYYLSISRAIPDNNVLELCDCFQNINHTLVLISNFSSSHYGREVLKKHSRSKNLILIDGLYDKPKLDCIRRNAFAYIHTHTLCGTAPSLVEAIIAARPIISIDVPQNRNTLNNECNYFSNFNDLPTFLNNKTLSFPSTQLRNMYNWSNVIDLYYSCL